MIIDTTTPQKQLFKTKYILCSEEQYNELNELISIASGYPDKTDTHIYADIIPIKDIDNNCVLPIVGDIQEFRSELIEGYSLVDTYKLIKPINNDGI